MDKDSLVNFIQTHLPVPNPAIATEIAGHFETRFMSKNSFFLKEEQLSHEYLFLESGFMRAFTHDTDGNEVTTNFYTGNNIVFEAASFFNHTRSQENIQALTDCQAYVITFDALNVLFHSIPAFREFGRAMLVKGFVTLKQRTLSLINETAEERYTHLLSHHKEIFQHAQLKHIASYLGITDTSLSRVRKEFSRK